MNKMTEQLVKRNIIITEGNSKKPDRRQPDTLQLQHPELETLCRATLDIDPDTLQQCLQLERVSLIRDLEHIILHTIDTFDAKTFDTEYDFHLIHAVFLLTELKAEESLPVILKIFRQNDLFYDCWFGDYFSELLWEPIVFLGNSSLPLFGELLKSPQVYDCFKSSLLECLLFIPLFFPEKRDELVPSLADLLSFFLAHRENRSGDNKGTAGAIVRAVTALQCASLLPLVKQLYDLGLIDTALCGDYESVEKAVILREGPHTERPEILSLEEKYRFLKKAWTREETDTNDDSHSEGDPSRPYIAPSKPSRNDTCPCGSGKKYKKCCGR
ncbi:MAG: DUF1186 domain-containing protein [Prevotellaceae bacterium]|jgi:hypothetical protein|nr:DUF1186 domain-containing protein [Prevotellaceae bacterium]